MSTPGSNPSRSSRFIEGLPDPPHSNELLFRILSQMDEFEKKRAPPTSRTSAESCRSSAHPGWLKRRKGLSISGRLRALVKPAGT
jgi:hypothetical protein